MVKNPAYKEKRDRVTPVAFSVEPVVSTGGCYMPPSAALRMPSVTIPTLVTPAP
jgi:hypothetical protein